jgi:hypothetical protein
MTYTRLSIGAVEGDVAQQRAKIDRLRHEVSLFGEGTPERKSAVGQLQVAERFLIAYTKLLAWTNGAYGPGGGRRMGAIR